MARPVEGLAGPRIDPDDLADFVLAKKIGVGVGIFSPQRPISMQQAEDGARAINALREGKTPEELKELEQSVRERLEAVGLKS